MQVTIQVRRLAHGADLPLPDYATAGAAGMDLLANARAKLARKGCDWIVANDISPASGIMGGAENLVHLVTKDGVEDWPRLAKDEVARRLAARIAAALA